MLRDFKLHPFGFKAGARQIRKSDFKTARFAKFGVLKSATCKSSDVRQLGINIRSSTRRHYYHYTSKYIVLDSRKNTPVNSGNNSHFLKTLQVLFYFLFIAAFSVQFNSLSGSKSKRDPLLFLLRCVCKRINAYDTIALAPRVSPTMKPFTDACS